MQLVLMEIFVKVKKRMMTEYSDQNKAVNSLVVNYILNYIEYEWGMPDTEPCRKREILMTLAYICVAYGYYLRGYTGFWVNCQRLIDGIHIGNYDRRDPHVIVSVMGRFMGEDGYSMHLLHMMNVTR